MGVSSLVLVTGCRSPPIATAEAEEADYTREVDAKNMRTALGEPRGMEAAFRALAALRGGGSFQGEPS
jgi:hypothetical protein